MFKYIFIFVNTNVYLIVHSVCSFGLEHMYTLFVPYLHVLKERKRIILSVILYFNLLLQKAYALLSLTTEKKNMRTSSVLWRYRFHHISKFFFTRTRYMIAQCAFIFCQGISSLRRMDVWDGNKTFLALTCRHVSETKRKYSISRRYLPRNTPSIYMVNLWTSPFKLKYIYINVLILLWVIDYISLIYLLFQM